MADMVPIFAIVFSLGGTIAIVALALRYKARKLEHTEIMRSIESGQELPMLEIKKKYNFLQDMRNGIILASVGLGILLFLKEGDSTMQDMYGIGFIPLFIGVGMVAIAVIVKNIEEQNKKNEDK